MRGEGRAVDTNQTRGLFRIPNLNGRRCQPGSGEPPYRSKDQPCALEALVDENASTFGLTSSHQSSTFSRTTS